MTNNFSGAEIEGLVRAATSTAMYRLIKVNLNTLYLRQLQVILDEGKLKNRFWRNFENEIMNSIYIFIYFWSVLG